MSGDLRGAISAMNQLPDISDGDSERLQGFTRMTAVEIKAVGSVGAATSLEMIGYIRGLEGINSQLCKDHNSLLLEIAKLQTSNTTARADAIGECLMEIETVVAGWIHDAKVKGRAFSDKANTATIIRKRLESLLNEKEKKDA
jgi:hypothetical protein